MPSPSKSTTVPQSLRTWFVLHFWIDLAFALPLLIAPRVPLELLGWEFVDPVSTRLVGAALLAIGCESWLGRNAPVAHYLGMLRLKMIWSGAASLGLTISIVQGAPAMAVLFLAIFALFFAVWTHFYTAIR